MIEKIEKIISVIAITIIIIAVACCIYSCTANEGKYATIDSHATSEYEELKLKQIGFNTNGYNYLVDENTGVVYLEYNGYKAHSISVMFNADGTVMTEKDILNTTNTTATPTNSDGE